MGFEMPSLQKAEKLPKKPRTIEEMNKTMDGYAQAMEGMKKTMGRFSNHESANKSNSSIEWERLMMERSEQNHRHWMEEKKTWQDEEDRELHRKVAGEKLKREEIKTHDIFDEHLGNLSARAGGQVAKRLEAYNEIVEANQTPESKAIKKAQQEVAEAEIEAAKKSDLSKIERGTNETIHS